MHLLTLLGVVCALAYLLWAFIIYPAFVSPLSKLPSAHFTCSISPAWILWQRYRHRENRAIHAAHTRLGKIVRLGPTEVSINSVDDGVRIVYGGFDKSNWYSNQFHNYSGVPCAFSMTRSKPHARRKRMMSNVYSKSYLYTSQDLDRITKSVIMNKLLRNVDSAAQAQRPVNALYLNYAVTMDMINAFIFGLGNGSDFVTDTKTAGEWFSTYQSRRHYHFWGGELPGMTELASRVGVELVPGFVWTATQFIEDWNTDKCKDAADWTTSLSEKADHASVTPALVYDRLRASLSTEEPTGPPQQIELEVASELIDHIAAGHDTSGITLTYLFWELSRNPSLQSSLREELLTLSPSLVRGGNHGKDTALPSLRALEQLPLLDAILMETLRLHPAIPGPQPRVTPSPPVSVAGSPPLPPGTRISAQPYSLHRNPDIFPDPEVWRPSRWLTARKDEKVEMMKWFWAFGSGSRGCIGSHFAMHEMRFVVAAIYSNYTTRIIDDSGIEQIDAYTAGPTGDSLMLAFDKVFDA